MKNTIFVFFIFLSFQSIAQNDYWQQYLHYSIDAKLNDKEKTITGNISAPSDYIVAATGVLQTFSESKSYKEIGIYNYAHKGNRPKLYQSLSNNHYKTLRYYADSVPDFAWFA